MRERDQNDSADLRLKSGGQQIENQMVLVSGGSASGRGKQPAGEGTMTSAP
jgi:hypothetical protein